MTGTPFEPGKGMTLEQITSYAVGYSLLEFLAGMVGADEVHNILGDRDPHVFARQMGGHAIDAVERTQRE